MKSVYWKMFLIFTCILLISFSIMAGFFYLELEEFTQNRRIELLNIIAGEIYLDVKNAPYDISSIPETYKQLEARNDVADYVRIYAENINSIIWVVNENGKIVVISKETEHDEEYFVRDFANRTEKYMFDTESYIPYFKSEETEFIATEAFKNIYGGGDSPPGLSYIKIYKLRGNDFTGEDFKIGIYIHTPAMELAVARRELVLTYVVPWILSLCVAGVLILLLARSFSKPLTSMMQTTRKVADGDFRARVKIKKRKDEIGELANTFNNMLDQIENLEISRQGFISDVSHELKTPITSINGFVEGILDGTIPEEKQEHYLRIVKSETARLNRLINNLLILSHLASDENSVEKNVFDLNELIRDVIIYMENDISTKGLEISAIFEDRKTFVYANRDDIERVIVNLLDNAVKFSNRGKCIYISAKAVKTKIMVSVRDEGCGISTDRLDLIWERFFKEDLSRGVSRNGSGLGLAIVKRIISAHGEKIDVVSEKDKGTEFVFSLQQGV